MRIALVTETFPPEVNGVAMTLDRLARGLSARGHTVEVLRPTPKESASTAESPFTEVRLPGLPLPGYGDLRFGLPAWRIFHKRWQANQPDVVHIATEGPLGWSALGAARKRGIPLSSSFHTNFHSYGEHYRYGFFMKLVLWHLRRIHNQTEVTFAPSRDVIEALEKSGFHNVRLLERGVDTELFQPSRRDPQLRRKWGAEDTDPVAIYVGRIAAEKNIELVVEAYRRLRSRNDRLKLVLVGDGPLRNQLEKDHPDLIFAGMQRGEALARHYASGDLFLFGSVTETFGNVVTEALASGLVVVAYEYAAPARFIRQGENGFLAKFGQADVFHQRCNEALEACDHWPALRREAVATVANLSWERIIGDFETTLARLAARD